LNIDPQLAVERTEKKYPERNQKDRLEKESIDFFQRINQGYLKLAGESPERFVCLDGSGSRENIHQKIIENLTIHLSNIPMERKSV